MKFSIEVSFVYSTLNLMAFRYISITLHIRKITKLQSRSTSEAKMAKTTSLVTGHCERSKHDEPTQGIERQLLKS
jgi:hypothetical protein